MYNKMYHIEKSKKNAKDEEKSESLITENEVYVKKLWNYDFFAITYD